MSFFFFIEYTAWVLHSSHGGLCLVVLGLLVFSPTVQAEAFGVFGFSKTSASGDKFGIFFGALNLPLASRLRSDLGQIDILNQPDR